LSTPSTPETDESSVFVKEEGSSTSTATPVQTIEGGPKLIDANPPPSDRVPAEAKSDEEAELLDPNTPSEAKRMEGRRGENAVGDLPGAIISEADRMLDKVYGDHVHQNPGTHLNGGIEDDAMWQGYHRRLIVYPLQRYDAPNGPVGHRLVETMTSLLEGVRSRKWNSECFLMFQIVVLQQTREVTQARDIKKRLKWRMDAWDEGNFTMLVQTTERDMESFLSTKQRGQSVAQREKIFNRKMLRGDVRGAVKYLTDSEVGGLLLPRKIDDKLGDTVEEVLLSKHPAARVPDTAKMPNFSEVPDLVDLDITNETVEKVASRLSGSAGVGGSDSHAVSHWLLRFGTASRCLRLAFAKFAEWMSNESPPWGPIMRS
jgi:hypothetical protein